MTNTPGPNMPIKGPPRRPIKGPPHPSPQNANPLASNDEKTACGICVLQPLRLGHGGLGLQLGLLGLQLGLPLCGVPLRLGRRVGRLLGPQHKLRSHGGLLEQLGLLQLGLASSWGCSWRGGRACCSWACSWACCWGCCWAWILCRHWCSRTPTHCPNGVLSPLNYAPFHHECGITIWEHGASGNQLTVLGL